MHSSGAAALFFLSASVLVIKCRSFPLIFSVFYYDWIRENTLQRETLLFLITFTPL
jgi:hypothetical protein